MTHAALPDLESAPAGVLADRGAHAPHQRFELCDAAIARIERLGRIDQRRRRARLSSAHAGQAKPATSVSRKAEADGRCSACR